MRLGLVEASQNKIGSPVDQILLFCYHYDPATGKYGAIAMNMVRFAGGTFRPDLRHIPVHRVAPRLAQRPPFPGARKVTRWALNYLYFRSQASSVAASVDHLLYFLLAVAVILLGWNLSLHLLLRDPLPAALRSGITG